MSRPVSVSIELLKTGVERSLKQTASELEKIEVTFRPQNTFMKKEKMSKPWSADLSLIHCSFLA